MPAIVGGQEAEVNSIPWQVFIVWKMMYVICGGTIIGPSTILTAAHCLDHGNDTLLNADDIVVGVGDHDISTGDESDAQ